jgi:hypothetical protein
MAMTFANYASLKEKLIYPELVDTLQSSNQTMAIWDMGTTNAPYIQVNRITTYPTVGAVDCSSSISASDISAAPVTFNFDTFQTTVPLCWDVKAGANAGGTAQAGILKAMLRAASEEVESLIIDGGTNFNGLDDLIVAGQTFSAASSAAGSVMDLSKAIRLTKGAGQKVFVANGATYDAVESVLRDASLASYQDLAGGLFNTISYRGIPVVINDNMTNGDVYLATLGGEGVSVVFEEVAGAKIGGVFDLINIPMALGSINEYYRVLFRATQVLHNPQALTKITGFAAA